MEKVGGIGGGEWIQAALANAESSVQAAMPISNQVERTVFLWDGYVINCTVNLVGVAEPKKWPGRNRW